MNNRRNSFVMTSTETSQRSRSGSFSGSIDIHHHDTHIGKLEYAYSGSKREFEVIYHRQSRWLDIVSASKAPMKP